MVSDEEAPAVAEDPGPSHGERRAAIQAHLAEQERKREQLRHDWRACPDGLSIADCLAQHRPVDTENLPELFR